MPYSREARRRAQALRARSTEWIADTFERGFRCVRTFARVNGVSPDTAREVLIERGVEFGYDRALARNVVMRLEDSVLTRLLEEERTYARVAARLGVSTTLVEVTYQRRGLGLGSGRNNTKIPWTREALMELERRGLGSTLIARALGVTANAVIDAQRRLGLRSPRARRGSEECRATLRRAGVNARQCPRVKLPDGRVVRTPIAVPPIDMAELNRLVLPPTTEATATSPSAFPKMRNTPVPMNGGDS
jgi:hypothetical protein